VLIAVALSGALLAVSAQAVDAVFDVKPAQIEALGILTKPAVADLTGSARGLPSTVLVPTGQQRLVASPVPGLVVSLHANVGDTVRAGAVVAELRSAQAQELQRDAVTTASQSSLASSTLARDEQLYREGLIPQSRLESSRSQATQAQLQQLDRQRALAQAGASAGGAGGVVTLTAPIDGVVLERSVVVGQRVDQAAALFRIGKLSPLWLEIQVPVDEAEEVRLGDNVQIARSTARGRVIAVAPTVDGASQTVIVRAELRQPPANLRIGQAVEARIERAQADTVQVPSAAVVEQAGKSVVFMEVKAGQFRIVPVQVTGSAGGLTSVKGLVVGSKVVVQGTAALKSLLASSRQ
jgi:RND family efflux transporter MFP subunit